MVNGQYEKALGDYDSAVHSLENALEINQRNSRFNRLVSCLMSLAEIEVARYKTNPENMHDDVSGPWMEQFQNNILERELTGYLGILFCLKSDLRFKQERYDEARNLVNEVLSISQQTGYEYLRNIVENLTIEKTVHFTKRYSRE